MISTKQNKAKMMLPICKSVSVFMLLNYNNIDDIETRYLLSNIQKNKKLSTLNEIEWSFKNCFVYHAIYCFYCSYSLSDIRYKVRGSSSFVMTLLNFF